LHLPGYGVYSTAFDEEALVARFWIRQTASNPFHTCSGCGIGTSEVHDSSQRSVRDLPWGAWKVVLAVEVHRVRCRRCGVRTERMEFLEGKHAYTRRFSEAVARDCEDAAVRRVASKWGLSQQTVRRIDKRMLQAWSARRKRHPLRQMGVDELFWKKGKCLTIVSDLELGEPIWAGPDRKRETLDVFFAEYLPARRRCSVKAVCVDMCAPFLASIKDHLPKAAIVFDKFQVMRHVNDAVDETRRLEFFRHKGPLRAAMRGKRWLLLTRWRNLSRSKRGQLNEAFALNRKLFKAYYFKEVIERLWTFTYEGAALRFFINWLLSLRWQRLPAFKKLKRTLADHIEGILAYCKHKVPFGVVEANQRQPSCADPTWPWLSRPRVPDPQGAEEHGPGSPDEGRVITGWSTDSGKEPIEERPRKGQVIGGGG
jgi:transposase